MAKSTGKTGASALQGGKVWFAAAIIVAVLAASGVFYVIQQVAATTTYYVLNQEVPARTQIAPEMLTPVVTSLGGEPRNALSVGDIQATPTYSKYALDPGDILSASNAGPLSPINEGVPADFVISSFQAAPENSVAGRVKRGDYIDIIGVSTDASGNAVSKYVLRRVMVLDVNSSLENATAAAPTMNGESAEATEAAPADTAAARVGPPTLYTVALPKEDAAKLALVSGDTLYVVLTSAADVENGAGSASILSNKSDVYSPSEVGDSGVGTSPNGEAENGATEGDAAQTEQPATEETAAPEETTEE